MTSFIGVASAKGGVGKTTTAINLTAALRDFKRETILVDCNLHKPNVGLYLGFTHTPKSLHSSLRGEHKLKDAIYKHPSGITVIPGNLSMDELSRTYTQQQLHDTLYQLVNEAEIVVVDTPPGLGPESRMVLSVVDHIILVTTADLMSVTDTLKTANLVKSLGKKILGVVVTHVREKEYELSLINIESTLGVPVIGVIPYDETLHHAQSLRHPVTYADMDSISTIGFRKLAANLIGEKYIPSISEKETFMEYLLERMHIKEPKIEEKEKKVT